MAATAAGTMVLVSTVQAANITTIGKSGATATKSAVRLDPPDPPTPSPTPPAPTPPTGPANGHFNTLLPGSTLPTGAACASQVRAAAEIRPENATANNTRGSQSNANTRTDWSGFKKVDGDFAGTTDELIQWAACKWGIDEDIVRAQAIKESNWYQSAIGDNGESFGITQVRTTAHQSAFQYTSVNAKNSTAYNLDYTYASWRACYEGVYTWLNSVDHNGTYAAGDVWGCVGVWFSGRWYVNTDAYLTQSGDSVEWHYNNKTWLTAAFING
jgi:flagellum-specific peptidoglycan hydrolase FlgJ